VAQSDRAGWAEVHVRKRCYIPRKQTLGGTGEVDPNESAPGQAGKG